MEDLRFVSPEYARHLNELAEQLVTPERYAAPIQQDIAQLALFETVEKPE